MVYVIAILFIWLIILSVQLSEKYNNINISINKVQKQVNFLEDLLKKQGIISDTDENENAKQTILNKNENSDINNELIQDNSENQNIKIQKNYEKDRDIIIDEFSTTKSSFSFETFFMGNIFNKIGAIAIIIGMAIFVKLISPFIVFTPKMQIVTAYFVAIGMVIGSLKLHYNKMKNYAEVLMGSGFAISFITTYCACSLYNMFNVPITVIIGSILVLATYFVARKYDSFATIVVGLFGGYLNPFFVNSDISLTFLFTYLLFVNLIGVIYICNNRDKCWLNCINLTLTTITVTIFSCISDMQIKYILPVLLWIIYMVNDFISARFEIKSVNKILSWLNFVSFIWFVNFIFDFDEHLAIGLSILTVGIIYAMCAWVIKPKSSIISKNYVYTVLLSVALATYFIDVNLYRSIVWFVEFVIFFFIFLKTNFEMVKNWSAIFLVPAVISGFFIDQIVVNTACFVAMASILLYISKKYNLNIICNWGISFLISSFLTLFSNFDLLALNSDKYHYNMIFNLRTLQFAMPIVVSFVFAKVLNDNKKIADMLQIFGLSFLYLWIALEISKCLNEFDLLSLITYSLIIVGLLYSLNIKWLSYTLKNSVFNVISHVMLIISIYFLIPCGWNYVQLDSYIPILNMRCFAYLIAIGVIAFFAKNTSSKNRNIYNYCLTILGALLVHCETQDYLLAHNLPLNIILSSVWLVYAGVIMLVGIFKNVRCLKMTGIWITILSIVKIVFFDLSNIATVYKLVEFLVLGIILMLVSYFYTKNKL